MREVGGVGVWACLPVHPLPGALMERLPAGGALCGELGEHSGLRCDREIKGAYQCLNRGVNRTERPRQVCVSGVEPE